MEKKSSFLALTFLLFSVAGCGEGTVPVTVGPPVTPTVSLRGTQQFGTTGNDIGRGIAVDSNRNIYVTGSTGGNLDGNISAGLLDIFLVKFNDLGVKQ